MDVKQLTTPWQRFRGAMFRKQLDKTILLFAYPHAAPRLFHTFLCPPLRIIALDDDGAILFDRVKQPGQFVGLPASRLIVEVDPDHKLSVGILKELASNTPQVMLDRELDV